MPNNINYPDGTLTIQSRPDRLSNFDIRLLTTGFKSVLFGTTEDDLVEVYFYDSNNEIDSHVNLYAPSDALSLTTVVDTDGNRQFLNVDLPKVASLANTLPGRYSMVLNFFRDEVGKEAGNHLYIKEISPSRTEVKLVPFFDSPEIFQEMYDFIVPSVSKLYAQALIDEIFGQSLDVLDNEQVSSANVIQELNRISLNFNSRLNHSDTKATLSMFIRSIIIQAHSKALNLLGAGDRNIQKVELQQLVSDAVDGAILELSPSLDGRFKLI